MLNIVSGCPRSGTSMMMDILREALGDERILGEKFPQEKRFDDSKLLDNEPEDHYQMRKYLKSLHLHKKDLDHSKDMNPNGFWEMKYTVKGIHYDLDDYENLQQILGDKQNKVCKIVSQGLARSEPQYIDKIIYMLRHPRAVAKSQERLISNTPKWKTYINTEDRIKHTPMMFINVTIEAANWLNTHNKPYIIVDFDDLIENPKEQIKRVKDFLNEEGDWDKATKIVDPKLRRSYPQDVSNSLWGEAELIYNSMKEKNLQPILDFITNWDTFYNREYDRYVCPRVMEMVNWKYCELCLNNKNFKNLLQKSAELKGIKWEEEPCSYRASKDITKPRISIEQTIKENHWND